MKKVYAIVNTVVILTVIFWNYWSNTGAIGGKTVGELSNEYANLFTPAGYAFAIWGIIFIGLIVLAVNQLELAFADSKHSNTILQIGPWLSIANLGNAAWLYCWLMEYTGVSVVIMLVILFSLVQVILRLNMERWDAPLKVIAPVWWPVCFYSGWIAVATIANISAYLSKIGWDGLGFSEVTWTVIMISVAAMLNIFMVIKRNMREFAVVGIWALMAIAARHWNEIPILQWSAVAWSVVLLVAISIHASMNKETNPFLRKVQPK